MNLDNGQLEESFRDQLGTIDQKGKRAWIYSSKPSGFYYQRRSIVSCGYLILFFALPFIRVNGNPLFQINIPEGKFILIGSVFWPQDFFLFGLIMMLGVVAIALFTWVYGRIFCGWICPQTVFMEMVFRKIEYWIEGDASKQRLLMRQRWNLDKISKKILKHLIFFILSFLIGNIFLSYIIGTDLLFQMMQHPLNQHWKWLAGVLFFTLVFYSVYAFARELVCTVICPYGRLQGVLLTKDSMVVAYDHVRGEPRDKFYKKKSDSSGHCIDCNQCVHVCPTGIDIRNGTQLECIHCTACMDACDFIMKKINRPTGLIRYTSENAIANRLKFKLNRRSRLYTLVLILLLGLVSYIVFTRSDLEVTVMRVPGQLYQEHADGTVSNLYTIKLTNKTSSKMIFNIKSERANSSIKWVGKSLSLIPREGREEGMFFLYLNKNEISSRKTTLRLAIYQEGKKVKIVTTVFWFL